MIRYDWRILADRRIMELKCRQCGIGVAQIIMGPDDDRYALCLACGEFTLVSTRRVLRTQNKMPPATSPEQLSVRSLPPGSALPTAIDKRDRKRRADK